MGGFHKEDEFDSMDVNSQFQEGTFMSSPTTSTGKSASGNQRTKAIENVANSVHKLAESLAADPDTQGITKENEIMGLLGKIERRLDELQQKK